LRRTCHLSSPTWTSAGTATVLHTRRRPPNPLGPAGPIRRGLRGRSPKGASLTAPRTRVAPRRPAAVPGVPAAAEGPTRAAADGTPPPATQRRGRAHRRTPEDVGAATTRPAAARTGTAAKGPVAVASATAAAGNRVAAAAVVGRPVPGVTPQRTPAGTRLPPAAAGGNSAVPVTAPGTVGGRAGTAVPTDRPTTGVTLLGATTAAAYSAAATTAVAKTAASTAAAAATPVTTRGFHE